jgi:hypothetical protein
MKIPFAYLLVMIFVLGLVGPISAQNDDPLEDVIIEGEVVAIPLADGLIRLDGDLSDWSNLPTYFVDYGIMLSDSPTTNPYYEFAVASDSNFFYIMMVTPDDVISTGFHEDMFWDEDSFEFYMNLTDDLELNEYEQGVFQINLNPGDMGNVDPDDITVTGLSSETAVVRACVFETEEGWGVEAALAYEPFDFVPEDGVDIGFNTHLNGTTEEEGDRNVKLIWSLWDVEDMSWGDPSVFGAGTFVAVDASDYATDGAPQPDEDAAEVTCNGDRVTFEE